MRRFLRSIALFLTMVTAPAGVGVRFVFADDSSPLPERPFGLAARIPLTTSMVVGSPDAPLPYRAVRTRQEWEVNFPIHVIHEPGTKNLFLSHQALSFGESRISRVIDNPGGAQSEFLFAIPDVAYSLCVHPRFEENGYLYIGSNGPRTSDVKHSRVTRYTVSRAAPALVDPESAVTIIEWKSNGHDGAAIAFGLDGMLYVTTGDGTSDSDGDLVGQRLDVLLAKVLRIDVDHPSENANYSVPDSNPFVGQSNVRPETWAYGVRAPWRAHVDPQTGQLWVTQNGQDLFEQVFAVQKGANYGWSVYEGNHPFYLERPLGPTPHVPPTFEHPHSEARSLTGGVTYYGQKFPELVGAYIYGDYSTGKIWAGKLNENREIEWHKEIADTTLAITSFGLDAEGELLITDHQGGGKGGLYTLEATPDNPEATTQFPRQLSRSGLFASIRDHQMADGVIPYSVNSPLWSDGSRKARFIALPESASADGQSPVITYHPTDAWAFPNGSILVKSFGFNLAPSSVATQPDTTPASQNWKWVETRFMVRHDNEWVGYSYAWRDDQSDADLVEREGRSAAYQIIREDGSLASQEWRFPSRTECMVCHSRAAGFVLGLSTPQMNRDHDYDGVIDNQLRALSHIGILKGLDKAPGECERLADPYDKTQPVAARARSYLHSNCAHCHVESGGGNAQMNLKFNATSETFKTIGVKPLHHKFGINVPELVAPGSPERSVLLHRMQIRQPGQMPQLATTVVDQQAVELIADWIRGLK